MPGRVTQYAVGVADLDRAGEVAARIQSAVGAGYEVESWRALAPVQRDLTQRIRLVMGFVVGILVLLVATGIVNTMLMSVYERVREIGTMMAVGVTRRQVLALFLLEAALLGVGGGAFGAALGTAVVRAIGARGFLFHPPGGDATRIFPSVPVRRTDNRKERSCSL